jgi:hypothetical protein
LFMLLDTLRKAWPLSSVCLGGGAAPPSCARSHGDLKRCSGPRQTTCTMPPTCEAGQKASATTMLHLLLGVAGCDSVVVAVAMLATAKGELPRSSSATGGGLASCWDASATNPASACGKGHHMHGIGNRLRRFAQPSFHRSQAQRSARSATQPETLSNDKRSNMKPLSHEWIPSRWPPPPKRNARLCHAPSWHGVAQATQPTNARPATSP